MADSDALRMRRSRAHRAGDHSLCKRCAAVRLAALPAEAPPVEDPVAELRRLAGRVVRAHEADPGNARLAGEVRMTLQALMGSGRSVDGELAEFLAGFSQA